jgi:cytochrome c-type biogenesis protein CcmF
MKFQFAVPLAIMTITFTILTIAFYKTGAELDFWAISCWSLCAFVLGSIGQEFWRGARVRQRTTKLDFFTSLIGLVGRSKRRYGGYLIHVAVVMLFFAWAGNAYKKEKEATLGPGKVMHVGGFDIRFDRLNRAEDLQKETFDARVTVSRAGKLVAVHKMPGIENYKKQADEGRITIPSITRFLSGDLYMTLAGWDPQSGSANIKAFFNPLVDWYWLGFMMIAFGTVICLAPDRAYSYAAAKKGVATATTTAAIILAILGAAHSVRAAPLQMPQTKVTHEPTGEAPEMTSKEKALFRQMGCTCPCNKQPLSDCTCGIADDLRKGIRAQMAAGMTNDAILAAYAKAHGPEFLVIPRSVIVWALPYGAAALGLGVIVVLARKWTRKPPAPAQEQAKVAGKPASEYDERLDDELRDLD